MSHKPISHFFLLTLVRAQSLPLKIGKSLGKSVYDFESLFFHLESHKAASYF